MKEGRKEGTLVVWNQPRAFGFIQPDDGSGKLFVHLTNFAVGDTPRLGARIEFEVGDPIEIGKKPQACHAKTVQTPSSAALVALSQCGKDVTGGGQ
jgi:cold shock CspA family protein